MGTDWRELLDAALRRVRFAEGHHQDLVDALARAETHPDVPLEVQRYFDALLMVFVAATEQSTDAILLAMRQQGDSRRQTLDAALKGIDPTLGQAIREWWEAPVVTDVSLLRNLSMHEHYSKRLASDGKWYVQEPRQGRGVSPRDIKSYADSVLAHALRLGPILDELFDELEKFSPPDGQGLV